MRAAPSARLSIAVSWTGLQGSCPSPCFPSMALSTRRLPSLLQGPGEPGSPALGSTMKALRLPIRVSTVTYWFAPAAHAILRLSCSLAALPGAAEVSPGPGLSFHRRPQAPAHFTWTRMGSLRSPGDPSRASAPLLDPGRTNVSSPYRPHRCCPRFAHSEGFGNCISGLAHAASAQA